jgi:hypothetical protein
MVFRRRKGEPVDALAAQIDVAAVPAGYRRPIDDALRARAQFGSLVANVPDGPLRARLEELGRRVDAGVLAVWETVQQALRLESVVVTLEPERVAAAYKQARRDHQLGTGDPSALEALGARFASTQRLLNSLDELRDRLPLLEARLGTAVARAAELTLTSSASVSAAGLDALDGELQALVVELEALGAGVDAVG